MGIAKSRVSRELYQDLVAHPALPYLLNVVSVLDHRDRPTMLDMEFESDSLPPELEGKWVCFNVIKHTKTIDDPGWFMSGKTDENGWPALIQPVLLKFTIEFTLDNELEKPENDDQL